MKGIISSNGFLFIERGVDLAAQHCPFDSPPEGINKSQCGSWCPLFGEPESDGNEVKLSICRKELVFEKFDDERPQSETTKRKGGKRD